ncbi:MAG: VanW family protein [bacterium]
MKFKKIIKFFPILILGILFFSQIFALGLFLKLNKKNTINLAALPCAYKKIAEVKNGIEFPETYFIAKKIKKEIISNGLELQFNEKSWEISEEDLENWVEISSLELSCPQTLISQNSGCSSFRISFEEKLIEDFLLKIKPEIDITPPNSKIYWEENQLKETPSQPGIELDIKETIQKIKSAAIGYKKICAIETTPVLAEITLEKLNNLGINSLLGTGKTSFAGSSKNRITNIKIGSGEINGKFVQPQEDFSVLKTIGEVNSEKGYQLEANIRDGKTVMALGGGLCQVSTTLFRAALNSGMKILERKNHAYPVGYYSPQGTDAAIASPNLDFKFKNDTDSPILIQARIENLQLFFDIFGAANDREVKIKCPSIVYKNENGSMKTVLYQEIYDKNLKKLIRKDTFYSYYRSKSDFPHE